MSMQVVWKELKRIDNNSLIRIRDVFRETADIIDEMLVLGEREDKGEDVKKNFESVIGRFTIKMLELESLQS